MDRADEPVRWGRYSPWLLIAAPLTARRLNIHTTYDVVALGELLIDFIQNWAVELLLLPKFKTILA